MRRLVRGRWKRCIQCGDSWQNGGRVNDLFHRIVLILAFVFLHCLTFFSFFLRRLYLRRPSAAVRALRFVGRMTLTCDITPMWRQIYWSRQVIVLPIRIQDVWFFRNWVIMLLWWCTPTCSWNWCDSDTTASDRLHARKIDYLILLPTLMQRGAMRQPCGPGDTGSPKMAECVAQARHSRHCYSMQIHDLAF